MKRIALLLFTLCVVACDEEPYEDAPDATPDAHAPWAWNTDANGTITVDFTDAGVPDADLEQ